MKIIVLGGSGFIGRHVCEKLAAAGHSITVPTRRLSSAKHLLPLPRLQLLQCNAHDSAQLLRAMAGHDVVVNLIAVLHGDEQRFDTVHVQLPQTIANACRAAGVPRVVHISALGAAPDAPSLYQRSKARGEAVLAASGLDVRLLRPSVVFGAEDKLLNLFASLQKMAPLMPLAGADTQFQPVWVEDVAQAVVHLATNNRLPTAVKFNPAKFNPAKTSPVPASSLDNTPASAFANRATTSVQSTRPIAAAHHAIFEACGPEALTLRQIVALAGRCVGAPRPIFALPAALANAQAWVLEHLPGEPLMSRDNLASMRVPNIASGTLPGLAELGITAASITTIAPTYLGAARTLDAYRKEVGLN
jgi:uncharacterized protein YbjT (DUF2867 family)